MRALRLGGAEVRVTDATDGSLKLLSGDDASLPMRQRRIAGDRPWAWARQVHGAAVVVVRDRFERPAAEADALVTATPDIALAVRTADCAPVALASAEGVVAAVHCGWRGLVEGVIPAAVAEMRALGATRIAAAVGPCIGAECYEFGAADLDRVAAVVGDGVRARTSTGAPALEARAGVRRALADAGVGPASFDLRCTACAADLWSHRAAADTARQALVVWRPARPSHPPVSPFAGIRAVG